MIQMRRVRTIFYGDQRLTPSEIELLHTPALQRLYDLHQLGLTDRVFIDASHSRLHHVVGVIHHADKLMAAIAKNLGEEVRRGIRRELKIGPHKQTKVEKIANLVRYVQERRNAARLMALLHDLTHAPYGHTLEDEIQLVDSKHDEPDRQAEAFYRLLCQLVAWLGIENDVDLTPHLAAYIDTADGCDLPPVNEVIETALALVTGPMTAHRMAHDFGPKAFAQLLRDLNLAMQSLLRLELLHKTEEKLCQNPRLVPLVEPYSFENVIREVLARAGQSPPTEFNPHKDAFLIDLIGNTVCADLLDYAQRDAHFTNIKTAYDPDRIVESFTLVSFESAHRNLRSEDGRLTDDPFCGYIMRPAVALFTHKLRTDIPSGILDLLHSRYNLHERALYHSTKCVAGAMLGRALELISLKPLPLQMLFVGDQVFLHEAVQAARLARHVLIEEQSATRGSQPLLLDAESVQRLSVQLKALPPMRTAQIARSLIVNRANRAGERGVSLDDVITELSGGIRLLEALVARRFHRTIFRILPNRKEAEHAHDAADKKKAQAEVIAEWFCDANNRLEAETAIENTAKLPRGSVVIHCPPYGGPAKVAEVLLLSHHVEGEEAHKTFRDARNLQDQMFADHVRAVDALEKMYWSTWRLTVSVAAPYFLEWMKLDTIICDEMARILKEKRRFTKIELANDPAMVAELRMAFHRANEPEEVQGRPQPVVRQASERKGIVEHVPVRRADLESLISRYGIVRADRFEVRHRIIPEFIESAHEVVGDHPDRWSLLAGRLLDYSLPISVCYNRVSAKAIRQRLTEILAEFQQESNNGQ